MGPSQAQKHTPNGKSEAKPINGETIAPAVRDLSPSAVAVAVMLGLVFGGCCSNASATVPWLSIRLLMD